MTIALSFSLPLESYSRSFVVQIQCDTDSATSDSFLTMRFVFQLERPITLRKV